jgi:hypothetical protein
MLVPERVQARRHPWNAARADADRVVHELRPEQHVELEELHFATLRAESWNRDEAVEVPRPAGLRVEVDPVSAAEQPRHDRLGDARGERRSHDRIGRASAGLEDLRTGLRGGRMPGGDGSAHARRVIPKEKGPPAATAPH